MDIKAYVSRTNVLHLLEQRGYDVSGYKNVSLMEVKMMYREEKLDMMVHKTDKSAKCLVKYMICKKCRCTDLKKIIIKAYSEELEGMDELIVVCKEKIRVTNAHDRFKNILDEYWEKNGYFVQLFQIEALMFRITDNELVPEHVKINQEELDQVLAKHNIVVENLPRISRYDPVAKYIGLRPGQVCKILRKNLASGEGSYYRRCD